MQCVLLYFIQRFLFHTSIEQNHEKQVSSVDILEHSVKLFSKLNTNCVYNVTNSILRETRKSLVQNFYVVISQRIMYIRPVIGMNIVYGIWQDHTGQRM